MGQGQLLVFPLVIGTLPGIFCPGLMLWLLAYTAPGLGRRAMPVVWR